MATNLDILSANLNQYVVRPLNAFGLGGFVFDVEGDSSVNLTAEITDHFLEDNSPIQDHIALRPKKVTLKSYVGEVVHRDDDDDSAGFVQRATQKLTILNSFLPELSKSAKQVRAAATSRESLSANLQNITIESVNKATDFYAFVKNISPPVTKQEQAYLYFKALLEGKFLLSVQTPFEFINNMAIESIVAEQEEKNRYVSNFSITLKQIRTVPQLRTNVNEERFVTIENPDQDIYQNRNFPQQQDEGLVVNTRGAETGDPLDIHLRARAEQVKIIEQMVLDGRL